MENTPEGAGMGTSGLVGQIFTFTSMGFELPILLQVMFLHFIGPALISLMISEFLRRKNLINYGDMMIKN